MPKILFKFDQKLSDSNPLKILFVSISKLHLNWNRRLDIDLTLCFSPFLPPSLLLSLCLSVCMSARYQVQNEIEQDLWSKPKADQPTNQTKIECASEAKHIRAKIVVEFIVFYQLLFSLLLLLLSIDLPSIASRKILPCTNILCTVQPISNVRMYLWNELKTRRKPMHTAIALQLQLYNIYPIRHAHTHTHTHSILFTSVLCSVLSLFTFLVMHAQSNTYMSAPVARCLTNTPSKQAGYARLG